MIVSTIRAKSFYSYERVLSYNAVINLICGARSIGKSYGAKKLVIKAAIKRGEQFVLVRRYKSELTEAKSTFFDDVAEQFPDHAFRITGSKAQMAKPLPDNIDEMPPHEQKRLRKEQKWVTVGHFMALSTGQTRKGSSFPLVKTIIFDEFIIEKGSLHYLPDEVTVLLNLYYTIARNRDNVRILMLSNSVSIDNPYMIRYEIRPDEAGELIVKADGFIVAHFPDSEEFKADVAQTRFGRFINQYDPAYADYAVNNIFSDNGGNLIELKDSNSKPLFSLETEKGTFSLWHNSLQGIYFIQKKTPRGGPIFTLVPGKVEPGKPLMTYSDKVMSYLRTGFRQGRVFFDDPATRNIFIEIFRR